MNHHELKCWSTFCVNYFLRYYLMMQHQPIVKRVNRTHEWAQRPHQLLITAACTNTGSKMKDSHSRAADRCSFVLRHSLSQVTSFMQLGMLWQVWKWFILQHTRQTKTGQDKECVTLPHRNEREGCPFWCEKYCISTCAWAVFQEHNAIVILVDRAYVLQSGVFGALKLSLFILFSNCFPSVNYWNLAWLRKTDPPVHNIWPSGLTQVVYYWVHGECNQRSGEARILLQQVVERIRPSLIHWYT